MEGMALIVALGIVVERLVEYAKKVKDNPVLFLTIGLGILMTFLFNVKMFEVLGMKTIDAADKVLTGIVISGGSNYIYDIVRKLTKKSTDNK